MQHDYLIHYGVKGQKWGRRRWTNEDGTLTTAGERRYGVEGDGPSRQLGSKSDPNYGNVQGAGGRPNSSYGPRDYAINERHVGYTDRNGHNNYFTVRTASRATEAQRMVNTMRRNDQAHAQQERRERMESRTTSRFGGTTTANKQRHARSGISDAGEYAKAVAQAKGADRFARKVTGTSRFEIGYDAERKARESSMSDRTSSNNTSQYNPQKTVDQDQERGKIRTEKERERQQRLAEKQAHDREVYGSSNTTRNSGSTTVSSASNTNAFQKGLSWVKKFLGGK